MIKKSEVEVRKADRHPRAPSRKQRTDRQLDLSVIAIVTVGLSIACFFVGIHLRDWIHRKPRLLKTDAIDVTVVASSTASTIIARTPDGHVLIVTSDFGPTTTTPTIKILKDDHISKINALIVTRVTPNTASGIILLMDQCAIAGPVITPYELADPQSWWDRSRHNFYLELRAHGLAPLSWSTCQEELSTAIPEADVSFIRPTQSRWEDPAVAARVSYGDRSLLDLTSLTANEVASITGQPTGGGCQLLVMSGQDEYVTKELLAQLQPDYVVLTGSQDIPPGDRALANVDAADAVPINLFQTPNVSMELPASIDQPIVLNRQQP